MNSIAETPLAIIGMACRLPGADNLNEFWQLLVEGRSDLGELPPDRFNRDLHYHPQKGVRTKSYTTLGGVTRERPFDVDACPLPQRLLDESHKVHLQLFEVAAAACRHAGLDPYGLSPMDVGVFIGHTPPSALAGKVIYARQIELTAQYLREIPEFNELTGGVQDAVIQQIVDRVRREFTPGDKRIKLHANAYHAAAIIAEGFNLNGPAVCFDAACASSLRALGHAARALQLGQIEMAIVGGASYCHADTLVLFSQAQSVSVTNGTCPFDNDADGLVAAEGYAVLAIKTLQRALADGDPIQAVVRRIGISSDGKGKSLWAPREEGQIEAIRRAYGNDLSLRDLQYIEMHATSTQVGDATEIGALNRVLREALPAGAKIPIGSVKANVGHTLETAGVASLIKTVLSMQHGVIPRQINIKKLNEKINWQDVPFFVPQSNLPWLPPSEGQPRRAAVNAFGIGGLNVHVVVDEHLPQASRALVAPKPNSSPSVRVADETAHESIAIIGMGAVLPGARTIDALWDALSSCRDQKITVPSKRWDPRFGYEADSNRLWGVPTKLGGFITDFEYDWKRHKVPPKQIASADPLQFMLLDAVDQAFKHAGFDQRPFDKIRTGVVVGTIFGGEFADQLQMGLRLPEFQALLTEILRQRGVPDEQIAQIAKKHEDLLLKYMPALIDETGSFTASTLASRITKTFDLMGGATALDSGETSAMSALSASIDLLRAGDCDMMLCAAGQRSMGLACYESMAKSGLLSTTAQPHGPFAADSTGCVPSEGVGVVILKRLSDAHRDGDTVHAVIRGIGVFRDASLRQGVRTAVRRCLEASNVSPDEVAVVESRACGVPQTDEQELIGLAQEYATGNRSENLLISTLAGQIGDTGGGSGMLELLKAVAELNHAEVPKNLDIERPASYVAANAATIRLADKQSPIRVTNSEGHAIAGVSCFSQYLVAYHLLVEGGTQIAQPARLPKPSATATALSPVGSAPGSWMIVRIAADTLSEVVAESARRSSSAASLFGSAESTQFQPTDRCRLAIVAESPDDLAAKLELSAKHLERPAARPLLVEKGIFYGETESIRPRVAFLFPGQGSQYDGMLKSLVDEYPPAAQTLHGVDTVLARLQLPSFADLAWTNGGRLGSDVWRTQLSLLAADTIVYAAASSMGLFADRVAGHSFGELAALTAAGSWTFEEAVRVTSGRCGAIDNCRQAGGMMVSTSAPASIIDRLCAEIVGAVSVSHRNAPEQTVAGGEKAAVLQLAEQVQALGFKTKILDVPAAFHTPLMEEVKGPFRKSLEEIRIRPPEVPLLSSVTNKYVADPADIRDNLVVQMTRPVDWKDLVQRLADEDVTVFVEVGPRQVLTGLNKQILKERAVAFVGCDHPKRSGLQQLLFARACLETTGALDPAVDSLAARISAAPQTSQSADASGSASEQLDESSAAAVLSKYEGLNVLRLAGSPYEMGLQHGESQREEIRTILRRYADLAGSRWEKLFDLDEAVTHPQVFFGPDELEELRGIAKGADVTLPSIIAHNLRLYLDANAGGVHFALTAQSNPEVGLLHGANEDLSKSVRINDCLTRNVQVRRPVGGLSYVTFGVVGQVGSLNGINQRGVVLSTATLTDVAKFANPQHGLLLTVLVKHVLEKAEDVDSAVELIRAATCPGRWGVCISQHTQDRVCYVEYDGAALKVQPSLTSVLAANHRLLYNFAREIPPDSEHRLNRLKDLLGGDRPKNVTVSQAQAALRDRFDLAHGREASSSTINTIRRIDNQISIVMQPAGGNLWVTGGPLANGRSNEFTQFKLADLLPKLAAPQQAIHENGAELKNQHSIISAETLAAAYAEPVKTGDHRICRRFVMRVVEAPATAVLRRPLQLKGAAIVLGDNPAARALVERLRRDDIPVSLLPVSDDADQTRAALVQLWQFRPAPHLFVMIAHDGDALTTLDSAGWMQRRTRGAVVPYWVCQRWYELVSSADLLDEATLMAATTLGGDFGFSGQLKNVESGALTGLLKGIALETKIQNRKQGFLAKVVDTSPNINPSKLADALCYELAADDDELEVGYIDDRRYLVRPVVESVESHKRSDIPHGANFVVTGGARGVTAVVARELGKQFGVKLNLIGSSPFPEIPDAYLDLSPLELKELRGTVMKEALSNGEKPPDVWRRFEKSLEIAKTLHSFAEDGLQATYHSCDISDRRALAALLQRIRAADGPIVGVIHGAGFERACRFEKKQRKLVECTVAAKVDGAAALMKLTRDDPVRYFAAFGSVSGRFGGVGQTDYCLANEMLSKLVDWYRTERPDCRATVFHWHAWDNVGMAVRPESRHIAKLHNITFMPSLEGTEHLIDELCAGLPEGEVVITEWGPCQEKYADVAAASSPTGPPSVETLPLIDAVRDMQLGKRLTAELRLDPTSDVFLLQHRYKGRPMLPVVITLEVLAEAASLLVGENSKISGLRNIEIVNGLRFFSDDPLSACIQAAVGEEEVRCEFTADFVNRRGQVLKKDQLYLRCLADVGDRRAAKNVTMPEPPDAWTDCWYPEEDIVIYHGPPFRTLRQSTVRDHDSWSRLVAPPLAELGGNRQGTGWILPPALLDGCLFASGVFLWFLFEGVVAIPAGIDRLIFGRPARPSENCTVHIHFRGREGDQGIFDFNLFGDDGTVILQMEGYHNIIVSEAPVHAN